jgi:hypothetical protein
MWEETSINESQVNLRSDGSWSSKRLGRNKKIYFIGRN